MIMRLSPSFSALRQRPPRIFLAYLLAALLCACSGQHLDVLPELPRKNWLDPSSEEKADAESIALSTNKKNPTFQDLIYWAIQQSPVISRSSVNLDIQQISLTDEKWKYLPEVHGIVTISNNITQYNRDLENDSRYRRAMSNYGEMAYQLSYATVFNNPIVTYFSISTQETILDIAINTHKKAIEACIVEMANIIVDIEAKIKSVEALRKYLAVLEKYKKYIDTADKYTPQIYNYNNIIRKERYYDVELQIDAAKIELTMLRNKLKQIIGLERENRLDIDTHVIDKELRGFSPDRTTWEQCWEAGTDYHLLQQQVKLKDAGVMLAWAQYVPTISISVNQNAPRGQSQISSAETDEFLHLTFRFPLLDWGHRYRGVEKSRAQRRQAMLNTIIRRREFRDNWFAVADKVALSRARVKQREHSIQALEQHMKALNVAHEQGKLSLPELFYSQQMLFDARFAAIKAEAEERKAMLEWMHLAHFFRDKYLNTADGGNK